MVLTRGQEKIKKTQKIKNNGKKNVTEKRKKIKNIKDTDEDIDNTNNIDNTDNIDNINEEIDNEEIDNEDNNEDNNEDSDNEYIPENNSITDTETDTDTDTETNNTNKETNNEEINIKNIESLIKVRNDEKLTEKQKELRDIIDDLFKKEYDDEIVTNEWMIKMSNKDIEEINKKMNEIREKIEKETPTLIKIINSGLTEKDKIMLINKYYIYSNMDEYTEERYQMKQYITNYIRMNEIKSKDKLKEITKLEEYFNKKTISEDTLKYRILMMDTSEENKTIIYRKYLELETQTIFETEVMKDKREWLEKIVNVPFGKYRKNEINKKSNKEDKQKYYEEFVTKLNSKVSFMNTAKDEIINLIGLSVNNPDANIRVIALEGPPGIGKTRLAQTGIAETLNRPFFRIPIGMLTTSNSLTGDRSVYMGSEPGKLIKMVMECGVMNPVVLIDEIDKVDENNTSIHNALTHILDDTQIKNFTDAYFEGIHFDLSKIMFILSYNDLSRVDSVIGDRIQKIKIEKPTNEEKIKIAKKHIFPEMLKNAGYNEDEIIITEDALRKILYMSRIREDGLRQYGRNIETIILRMNMLIQTKDTNIKLGYKIDKEILEKQPIIINSEVCEKLFWEPEEDDIIQKMFS